jgi:hypothetical protein
MRKKVAIPLFWAVLIAAVLVATHFVVARSGMPSGVVSSGYLH